MISLKKGNLKVLLYIIYEGGGGIKMKDTTINDLSRGNLKLY